MESERIAPSIGDTIPCDCSDGKGCGWGVRALPAGAMVSVEFVRIDALGRLPQSVSVLLGTPAVRDLALILQEIALDIETGGAK